MFLQPETAVSRRLEEIGSRCWTVTISGIPKSWSDRRRFTACIPSTAGHTPWRGGYATVTKYGKKRSMPNLPVHALPTIFPFAKSPPRR
ncbi:hypothetical protein D1872_262420 [compost metagenome]